MNRYRTPCLPSNVWGPRLACTIRTNAEALTKKKLEYNAKNLTNFDAVLFFTSGDLEMDAQHKSDFRAEAKAKPSARKS